MAVRKNFSRKNLKLDEKSLWEYALRVLGQRAHSLGELKQKLWKRAASPQELNAVLDKVREYGLADDRRFSEALASSRLQNSGFGQFRVLRELRQKRVAPAVAEAAVKKTFSGTDEKDLIRQFLRRKYRSIDLRVFLKESKNLASVYRKLRTAGFSSTAVLATLKDYNQATEDWAEPDEEEQRVD
jgi:regulatory protein